MLKIVSIICFSLFLCGCDLLRPSFEWEKPLLPVTQKVEFKKVEDGYFISENDAERLADNTDELKAYIEKLEILIKEMEKYYE